MYRMFTAARLFTGGMINSHNSLAIRKLKQFKKGKLFLRCFYTELKPEQGNEIYLPRPNCQVQLI